MTGQYHTILLQKITLNVKQYKNNFLRDLWGKKNRPKETQSLDLVFGFQ